MLPLALRGRIRQGLAYGVSLGLGFMVVAAPWSYRLEMRFGNPLFPLMNNRFPFTGIHHRDRCAHLRFIPATVTEALWRPFAMIDPATMVHEEMRAPDLRYAVLLILLGALFVSMAVAAPHSLLRVDQRRMLVRLRRAYWSRLARCPRCGLGRLAERIRQ